MNNFLSYITETSLALTAFYAAYYFILRHKAAADFNRYYLLASLVFALCLPFIHIPLGTTQISSGTTLLEPANQAWNFLPELVVYSKGQPAETAASGTAFPWLYRAGFAYLTGVMLCLLMSSLRLLRLQKLIRRYPFRYSGDYSYQLASTNGDHPTFSFLNYIFWDNTAPLSKEEAQQVLRHEIAHVKKRHSLDLLFLELVKALLWFNPLIYLIRRSLLQVHEFQADQYVLQQGEPESYLRLMVKQTFRQANIPLVSTFFQHNTLTRIRMIQSKPTNTILRASFSMLLAGSIFFVAACEDEAEKLVDEPKLMELSAEEHLAVETAVKLIVIKTNSQQQNIAVDYGNESIRISSRENTFIITDFKDEQTRNKVMNALNGLQAETLQDNGDELLKLLMDATEGNVKHIKQTLNSSEDLSVTAPPPPPFADDISEETQLDPDQIFEVVEDQPEPVGGMEAFYEFVGQRLRYPEEARAAGIEGRVFIQFVVDEQGNVGEVKAVKGLGHGLDEAAEDMIRETKWEPGKQRGRAVKVRMIMPVTFKLSAD